MASAQDRYGYGSTDRPCELTDTSLSEGVFFEIESPAGDVGQRVTLSTVDGSNDGGSQRAHEPGDAMNYYEGEASNVTAEEGPGRPRPGIVLRWKRLLIFVALSVLFIMGLTVLFYYGISMMKLYEPVGESDESESKVREYNTYSGALMGIFETFIGLGFANFFPAFTVYVHNLKWWPGDDPTAKTSKFKKVALLFFFPLVMIAIGNSFSAMQAGASTIGSLIQMEAKTLGVLSTNYTLLNVSAFDGNIMNHESTILKTAIQRRSTPFQYVRSSRCLTTFENKTTQPAVKRIADIDSTSTIFGFPVKEWGRELYPEGKPKFSDATLDTDTSFELMFQGMAFLERSVGRLTTASGRCRYVNGSDTASCIKRNQTAMDGLYGYFNGTKEKSASALSSEVLRILRNAFYEDLDESTLLLSYSSFQINNQMKYNGMSISILFKQDYQYGVPDDTDIIPEGCTGSDCNYRYNFYDGDTFCGSDNCVFPDWNAEFIPRREALMMQYKKNCQQASSSFDASLQAHIPGGCETVANSAFLYGFGTRIFGDTLGIRTDTSKTIPYIMNPKRYLRFTIGKLSWEFKNLTEGFEDANCDHTSSEEPCVGLMHKLEDSKRHILLGKGFLPSKFVKSDFRSPITLFELILPIIQNSPRISNGRAMLEQLRNTSFLTKDAVTTVRLPDSQCSFRADAYIKHILTNVYQVYNPFQPMYTSAMLYLFQDATVTKLRKDEDGEWATRFAGDKAVSEVNVKNTEVGVYTVWIGCIILVILAAVTLLFPNERARLVPMMGKNARAERFIAVQTEEVYPNLVYMKRFRIGKTGEALKFNEFSVESVALHHYMEEDEDQVIL
uniref:Uncharacterized protein n=1 Tax=Globisporangium ultimum (strain ATCC 200006 / CBS 805.95 / DAOM BR144) TaxID=431595 RepID=K3X340_GLOUD